MKKFDGYLVIIGISIIALAVAYMEIVDVFFGYEIIFELVLVTVAMIQGVTSMICDWQKLGRVISWTSIGIHGLLLILVVLYGNSNGMYTYFKVSSLYELLWIPCSILCLEILQIYFRRRDEAREEKHRRRKGEMWLGYLCLIAMITINIGTTYHRTFAYGQSAVDGETYFVSSREAALEANKERLDELAQKNYIELRSSRKYLVGLSEERTVDMVLGDMADADKDYEGISTWKDIEYIEAKGNNLCGITKDGKLRIAGFGNGGQLCFDGLDDVTYAFIDSYSLTFYRGERVYNLSEEGFAYSKVE